MSMWEAALGAIVFTFLCLRFLFFHRQSHRTWYIVAGIATGLASIEAWIRLGHLLGFWSFYL